MLSDLQDINRNQTAEATPLLCQVAGHSSQKSSKSIGMMSIKGGYVLKPILKPKLGSREIQFYESLKCPADEMDKQLATFVPRYFGTTELWMNNERVQWLVLEDTCHGFAEPCVMDIKIGRQTWDPEAPEEKKQAESSKYTASKRELGFCIPGFQIYDVGSGELRRFDSDFGKSLNGDGVRNALSLFLNGHLDYSRTLLLQLLAKLWQIVRWFRNQTKYHIFGSSVLLAYDAAKLRETIRSYQIPRNGVHRPTIGRQLSLRVSTGPLTPGFEASRPKSPGASSLGSRSAVSSPTTPHSPYSSIHNWHDVFDNVCRTHSLENNYERDLKSMKENYSVVLKDLVGDHGKSDCWASVKMIDFAHVFPANSIDKNYLEGVENLVAILEEFLKDADS